MPVIHPPKLAHPPGISTARRRPRPLSLVPPRVISPLPREDAAQLVEDLITLIESGLVVPILDAAAVRYVAADRSGGGWE